MERVQKCSRVQCTVVESGAVVCSEFGQNRGQIGGQRGIDLDIWRGRGLLGIFYLSIQR